MDHETATARWKRRGTLALAAILCVVIGTGTGLWLTRRVVRSDAWVGATRVGSWRFWPDAGRTDINPYLRARMARSGEIPLAAAEGITAFAFYDDAGQPLRRACDYRIAGPVPAALFWSIEAAAENGAPLDNPAQRHGFTASDVLRNSDGGFIVEVGSTARPGNWLPLSGTGMFVLVLRLYDTPMASSGGKEGRSLAFPSIIKDRCA